MKITCQIHTWSFHREIDYKNNESVSITIHGKTEFGERYQSFEIIAQERKDLGKVLGYICKPFGFDDETGNSLMPIIVNIPSEKVIELYNDLTRAKTIATDLAIAIFTGKRPTNLKDTVWEWDMTEDIEIESWGYSIGFKD